MGELLPHIPVVVAQIPRGQFQGVLGQAEIGEPDDPRLPLPTGFGPRRADPVGERRSLLRWRTADCPPDPPLRGSPDCGLRHAADQDRHRSSDRRGADRVLSPIDELALPCPVHELQGFVESLAPVLEPLARSFIVVLAGTHAEPQDEPAAGELVHAGRFLGQQDRVPGRLEEHVGDQADPLRDGGRRG